MEVETIWGKSYRVTGYWTESGAFLNKPAKDKTIAVEAGNMAIPLPQVSNWDKLTNVK